MTKRFVSSTCCVTRIVHKNTSEKEKPNMKAKVEIFHYLIVISILTRAAQCGKILFWMDFGCKSHYIVWKPLMESLLGKGHELTIVAPFDDRVLANHSNVRFAHIDNSWYDDIFDSAEIFQGKPPTDPDSYANNLIKVQESAFHHRIVRKLMDDPSEYFDAVVLSPLSADLGLYLAKHRFAAPLIIYSMPLR